MSSSVVPCPARTGQHLPPARERPPWRRGHGSAERSAGTGRPAGDADALLPQRHQELFALDARHTECRWPGSTPTPAAAAGRRGVAPSTVAAAVAQPVALGGDPARPLAALGGHQAQRCGQPDGAGDVLGAAAPLGVLPPPYWRGSSTTLPAMASAPTPTGPPTLCALSDTRSAPEVASARSMKGAACTASVNTQALGARRRTTAMRSASGCSTPVSLLAVMTATPVTRDKRVRQRVGIDDAVVVDGELAGVETGLGRGTADSAHGRVLHRRIQEDRFAPVLPGRRGGPSTARLADSVPPDVKTTSPGSRPRNAATSSRASSSRRRARWAGAVAPGRVAECAAPAPWTSAMAAATSGRSGAAAAWSRGEGAHGDREVTGIGTTQHIVTRRRPSWRW